MPEKCLDEVKSEVKRLIAEITESEEGAVTEEADLANDLGVDSMMALEIVAGLEKRYRVKIPEQSIPLIRSFGNVMDLLAGLMEKQANES